MLKNKILRSSLTKLKLINKLPKAHVINMPTLTECIDKGSNPP